MRACWLGAALLCACGGASTGEDPAARRLYGEVHVHGFAGGSHPAALFLGVGTPAGRVRGDDIVDEAPPPEASAGACTLSAVGCAGACLPPAPIDGGAVRILGGRGVPEVTLTFQPAQDTYLATPPPVGAIFAGGETLVIEGDGARAPAFHGELRAPPPLVLTQPAARPRLGAGALTVAWIPDRATRVDVVLVASTGDGQAAIIECVADDAAAQVVVPAELLGRLPPPPRDLQLLASRDEIALAASVRPDQAVLLHAGFEASIDWHEAP